MSKDESGYVQQQWGAYREFDHEPYEWEDYLARWDMAHQFAAAIFRSADVIRQRRPRFDEDGNPAGDKWTIALKLRICIRPCARKVCRVLREGQR